MKYVLENSDEAARLERQSRSALYDPNDDLEGLEIAPGQSVLDAGCGSGLLARAVAERFPKTKVFGVDAFETRIAEARRLATEYPAVSFQVANITEPLPNTYDRVVCRFVIEHLSAANQTLALKNLAASLKPGGRLRVVDMDGGMLNIFPRTPLLEEVLSLFELKKPIDFFVGRKLPKLLIDAGLEQVSWDIRTLSMNTPESLKEETKLVSERFLHTLPAIAELVGSEEKALRFQKEYLDVLQRPGTTLFYNKFVATGCRPSGASTRKLRAL